VNVLSWIAVGALGWLVLAVAVGLVVGAVLRNRDRQELKFVNRREHEMGWGKSTSWVPDPAQARVDRALREKREREERQAAREAREAAERERRAKPNCRADKNVRRRG
jgi:hypothetical protein